MGKLQYFLGLKLVRSNQGLLISQQKYIKDLLKEIGMLRCKLAKTPIEHNDILEEKFES